MIDLISNPDSVFTVKYHERFDLTWKSNLCTFCRFNVINSAFKTKYNSCRNGYFLIDTIGEEGQHGDVDAIFDDIEDVVDGGGRPARLLNLNEERDAERNQVDELLDEEE